MSGGHMYMVAVERDMPKYPGLLLENPIYTINENAVAGMNYYAEKNNTTRFKGKIFYTFLLDTCEDINDESLKVFKRFFDQQLVIE